MGIGSFPGTNRPRRGVDHPPPSSAEVKVRVELYLYSPSGPSWLFLGWNLHLLLPSAKISDNKHEVPHYIQAVQTFNDLGYSTFRKLERLSSFVKVWIEYVCVCVCACVSKSNIHVCPEESKSNPNSNNIATWSAAALQPCRICYRPVVFFRHLRLFLCVLIPAAKNSASILNIMSFYFSTSFNGVRQKLQMRSSLSATVVNFSSAAFTHLPQFYIY